MNLLHYPAPNVMFGAELQYGYRENFTDGWTADDFKVQFSFKYNFSYPLEENHDSLQPFSKTGVWLLGCLVIALALAPMVASAQTPAEIQAALDAAYAKYKDLEEGANADYIPALAAVDSNIYGIALVTTDGKVYTAGDIKSEVSIQSISKVFTMAKVIEESGTRCIADNIGVDATGHVLQLDRLDRVLREVLGRTGDERPGQPGRDHRDQHGQGRRPRRDLETASSATTPTSPAGR